jgi:hypothetical protein
LHRNYRRKHPRTTTKREGNGRGWWKVYSLRWWKKQRARDRRARDRSLIERGKYDDLTTRYPMDILWDYW